MANAGFTLRYLILALFVVFIGQADTFGQKPIKCRLENRDDRAPKYRIGWTTYSAKGPRTLFLAISIDPRRFSSDDMVSLARRIKQDFCQEERINVEIFDDYRAARSFFPTSEIEWFHERWRGTYYLDRSSGVEEISFSTAPGKPKDEVKLNLSAPVRD